jgi:hypothetical protein
LHSSIHIFLFETSSPCKCEGFNLIVMKLKKLIKLYYKIYYTLFKRKEILDRIDRFIDSRRCHYLDALEALYNNDIEKFEYHIVRWQHYKLLIEENYNRILL